MLIVLLKENVVKFNVCVVFVVLVELKGGFLMG